jgi:hypothetical protein
VNCDMGRMKFFPWGEFSVGIVEFEFLLIGK